MGAKLGFAKIDKLPMHNDTFDFYSTEEKLVVSLLKREISYTVFSECSNPNCLVPSSSNSEFGYPHVSDGCVNGEQLTDEIFQWVERKRSGICGQRYTTMPLPDNKQVFWNENLSTGDRSPFCNAVRVFSVKQFNGGLPVFLIVNVESLESKYLKIIPKDIDLHGEKKYHLIGVTLHRYGKNMCNHYTAILNTKANGNLLYYDGWKTVPLESSPLNVNLVINHTLLHCMYILV